MPAADDVIANSVDRLKHRRQFLAVSSQGRSFATAGLVLQMLDHRSCTAADRPDRNGEAGLVRFGITASKRVGNAVRRNRARRRLRVLAETLLPLHGCGGCDYVLIGRAATVGRPFAALTADLMGALVAVNAGRGVVRRPDRGGSGGPVTARRRRSGASGGPRPAPTGKEGHSTP